ncbi:hypothetical protein ONZ45_g709 [Pleurotus djamor]|nr:hypothetical protein ONZ45_g709 [Pleurotus djamor]
MVSLFQASSRKPGFAEFIHRLPDHWKREQVRIQFPLYAFAASWKSAGDRFVLANTEVLHDKIGVLSNRVRQLEDALAESHSRYSNDLHPLLTEELRQLKRPLERETDMPTMQPQDKPDNNDAIDALGSLSISQKGQTTYFGTPANAWVCVFLYPVLDVVDNGISSNEEGSDGEMEEEQGPIFDYSKPYDLPWLSHAFPLAPPIHKAAESLRGAVLDLLPIATDAMRLSNNYYRHAAWMYTPIPEADFTQNVLRPLYGDGSEGSLSSHSLALLCLVLALGSLLDLDKPVDPAEHCKYYQLGRAALSIDSVFEEQSITAIQALLVMCHYMFLSHIDGPRWAIMGLVVKLAHSVGLHRDSGKWNLDNEETQKRRCLLWEIYTYDSWQSLTFGRPPSFALCHVDTKMPFEKTQNEKGEVEMTFAAWKHRFASECLSHVQDQAFGARAPSYKTIQELDKSVKDFYIPPSLQVPGFVGVTGGADLEQPTVEVTMQRYIAFAIKEITLFYMHRGFFARALEECPSDPMSRSIAAKARMGLAPSALSHFDTALRLFGQVKENPRSGRVLPVLRRIKEVIHSGTQPHSPLYVKKEGDEISALRGGTRLVTRRTSSTPSSPTNTASPSSVPASPPPLVGDLSPPFQQPPMLPTSPWTSYNQLQGFGAAFNNTNNGAYSLSPNPPHQHPIDMGYSYTRSPAQSMAFDATPEYYASMSGYSDPSASNRMNYWPQQPQMMQQAGEMYTSHADLNASWHNLMDQFK